ncbi:uncharacterized protein [Littorina saxatilis]|uniref:Uncharacterized protein n=1 Tax=Littorina saxatilis TaxID=31220 RepID=A0AAN9B469_9CAEN
MLTERHMFVLMLGLACAQIQVDGRNTNAHKTNAEIELLQITDNTTKNKTFAYAVPGSNANDNSSINNDAAILLHVSNAATTSTSQIITLTIVLEDDTINGTNASRHSTMTPEVDDDDAVNVGLAAGLTITAVVVVFGCVFLAWQLRKQLTKQDGIWNASQRIPMTAARKRWLERLASDEQALA